jgi:hypothetical protein
LAIVVLVFAVFPAANAAAHAMNTSAVLLDIESHKVTGEIQLPLDRLSVALKKTVTPAVARATHAQIERYSAAHLGATGTDGRRWSVRVGTGTVKRVGNTTDFVMPITLTPPGGRFTNFTLRDDIILEQLVTHRIIVTIRTQFTTGTLKDPQTLGVIDWNHRAVRVDAAGGSWLRGFLATAGLGVEHIASGADHLLFLLMLLIPAPLLVRRRRWVRRDSGRESAVRVVHVVTAFAVGHSTTLALATFGLVHLPTRLVESGIALSIAVSAVHALRPLARGGEAIIALCFGLVHGLAFATLLSGYGLHGGALVSSLLGFNLGIEVTQLLVVALMMPSLYLLSRTAIYGALRVGVALFGLVLSGAWFLERTTLIPRDPFASVSEGLIAHPFVIAGVFALAAAISQYLPIQRARTLTT